MKLFSNLTNDTLEKAEDRVGGYQPLDSDIYKGTIETVYADKTESGAQNLNFTFKLDDGRTYSETVYVTNREGKNFFEKNGKKFPLPGYTLANDICLITTGKGLDDQDFENKVFEVYSAEAKKRVPQQRPAPMDLMGKPIALAIISQEVPKQVLQNGVYVDSDEMRQQNAIEKALHPELKVTVLEAQSEVDPVYWDKWLKANKGKVRTKKNKASSQATAAAPKKSLFGN